MTDWAPGAAIPPRASEPPPSPPPASGRPDELAALRERAEKAERQYVEAVQVIETCREHIRLVDETYTAVERERDGVRAELARMAGDLDDARATLARWRPVIREIHRWAAGEITGDALVAAADALSAPQSPGPDSGTTEPLTAGSVDPGPASGAVAANHGYVACELPMDGRRWCIRPIEHHGDCAWSIPVDEPTHVAHMHGLDMGISPIPPKGKPRVWSLPDEPGPEVKAVRDSAGEVWTRSSPTARLSGWYCKGLGIAKPWRVVLMYGPVTDATGETP